MAPLSFFSKNLYSKRFIRSDEMFVTEFLKDQFTAVPLEKGDLTGKTVIVVGANVGLGLEGEPINRRLLLGN